MTTLRTSAMRQEEEMRRAQGLPAQSAAGNALAGPLESLALFSLANQLPSPSSMFESAPSLIGGAAPSLGAAPAAPVGISATSIPAAPASGFSLAGIGRAGNYIAPAAGAFGLFDALSNDREGLRGYLQSGLSGAGLGSYFGKIGAVVGAGLGILGKLGQDLFDSGKSREQKDRDSLRTFLEGQGFLQRNEQGAHINPISGFNWGLDGKNTLTNEAGQQRRRFEVDFNDPRAAQTTAFLDPLGTLMNYQAGINGDQRTNTVGYLVNDALSQGQDPQATALAMYQRYGLSPDQVLQGLTELSQAGKLTQDQFASMTNTVNSLSSPGQAIGGGSYSVPSPIPRMDISMLRAPQDPMSQARDQMTMRQRMPVYNQQTSQPQMPSLFPSRGRKIYQPLLALGGA